MSLSQILDKLLPVANGYLRSIGRALLDDPRPTTHYLQLTMATIQIDRLLETTVRRKASDLHLAVGKPPTLRMHGDLRELQTKVLEAEDTVALMKSDHARAHSAGI